MNNDDIISFAKSRFDHQTAKRILKEKYQGRMTFVYNEGMFRAGPELLTLLQSISNTESREIVILDLYENPIKINCQELKTLSEKIWQEQMNAWLLEFTDLNKQR